MFHINNANEPKRRVGIYIRVSTAEQGLEGYSLDAQKKKLTEYVNGNAALNLMTKPEWLYSDIHTGSDLNRDGLNHLLEDVKNGKFDAVLVLKIDRLSRSLKHLLHIFEYLKEHDVSFISMQENIDFKGPIGSLIFQIFGAIAQFERELIKGRTMMGRIASAELGNFTGTHIPYGYRPKMNENGKGKRLEVIPEEKKWVEQMYDWYIFEDIGDGQIADKLNGLEVPRWKWEKNQNGIWAKSRTVPWSDKMVTHILTTTLYRGDFLANTKDEAGNTLPEDQHTIVAVPACVSEFTFKQAEVIRENKVGGSTDTDYLLSGKMKDYMLEKPKTFVGAKRSKGGISYRRKQFKDKNTGEWYPVFEIPGKQIEEYVWGKVLEAMKDPEIFIQHYLSREYADPTKVERLQQRLHNLRQQELNAEVAMGRIEKAYDDGSYSQEKMAQKLSEKNAEIADISTKTQELENELRLISSIDIEVQKLRDASEQIKYRMDNLDRKQKKILCNLFIDEIQMKRKTVINEKGKEGWHVTANILFRFNPDKLSKLSKEDRTKKSQQGATKSGTKRSKDVNGGPGGS